MPEDLFYQFVVLIREVKQDGHEVYKAYAAFILAQIFLTLQHQHTTSISSSLK